MAAIKAVGTRSLRAIRRDNQDDDLQTDPRVMLFSLTPRRKVSMQNMKTEQDTSVSKKTT